MGGKCRKHVKIGNCLATLRESCLLFFFMTRMAFKVGEGRVEKQSPKQTHFRAVDTYRRTTRAAILAWNFCTYFRVSFGQLSLAWFCVLTDGEAFSLRLWVDNTPHYWRHIKTLFRGEAKGESIWRLDQLASHHRGNASLRTGKHPHQPRQ